MPTLTVMEASEAIRKIRSSVNKEHSELTNSKAWKALEVHYAELRDVTMRNLFENDAQRFERFSIEFEDILFDYSKNRFTEYTRDLMVKLAKELNLQDKIAAMFDGQKVNWTENRAVLHTALRNRSDKEVHVNGEDVMPLVHTELEHMREFTEQVRMGGWKGHAGERITDVVSIGIGGSDLGARMVCEALQPYQIAEMNFHFLSNVDGSQIAGIIKKVKPETTLFVVVSKTFTTLETMTNARTARDWLLNYLGDEEAVAKHFVAVSTNESGVVEFGIAKENMFRFWNWVGGRYSLWSTVGLPIALAIGMDNFEELLDGAHAMDEHFRKSPLDQNIPFIMATLGIWYVNFFMAPNHAVLPYDQNLDALVEYLQQLDMESNGKAIKKNEDPVDHATGPVVWGRAGTNGQHAFYQLLHQGTAMIPCDFIAPIESSNPVGEHHHILLANFLAQSEALMKGRTRDETRQILELQELQQSDIVKLLPHMTFNGNRPSNTILLKRITPRSLGSLLAMYEHKVMVQGMIWDINSYDQWGVELGKTLAKTILRELKSSSTVFKHDSSTNGLMNYIKQSKE